MLLFSFWAWPNPNSSLSYSRRRPGVGCERRNLKISRILALSLAATISASPAMAGDWHGGGGGGWHGGGRGGWGGRRRLAWAHRHLRLVLGGLRPRRAGSGRRAGCALCLRATASLLSAAALRLSAPRVSTARVCAGIFAAGASAPSPSRGLDLHTPAAARADLAGWLARCRWRAERHSAREADPDAPDPSCAERLAQVRP